MRVAQFLKLDAAPGYVNYFNYADCYAIHKRRNVLTGKELEIFLDAVVAGETVIRVPQCVAAVDLHSLYHEADVVCPSVLIEICKRPGRN